MPSPKRTVLITGCSDGGLGSALAIAFHNAGLHVIATARNPAKMSKVKELGIETLVLDVMSDESIKACVAQVPHLDILVNNAGGAYSMPVSDMSIPDAKAIFDLNVWSYIAVTQAFLPLLIKSKGMVVHQTSTASHLSIPFQSTYNASKAAMASFSDTMRLELGIFGVRVVDLKAGLIRTKFIQNRVDSSSTALPKGSIYEPARAHVEKTLRGEGFTDKGTDPDVFAKKVVSQLLKKTPPSVVWEGESAGTVRLSTIFPQGSLDGTLKKLTGFPEIEKAMHG